MFCRAKNFTSTPSTAPTTRGKCVCLSCASVLWRVFTVRGPVILSGSHLHMLPSQPLTWLHCAAPMNVLPFFPLPRQPDTLHRRHLGRSRNVWVLLCLRLRLPHPTHPAHTHPPPLPFFYPQPIDRVTACALTDGGITAVTPSRRALVMFYCASVVPRDTSARGVPLVLGVYLASVYLYIHTHVQKFGGQWLISAIKSIRISLNSLMWDESGSCYLWMFNRMWF